MIKISFLSENKTGNPSCMAEHGLSVFIETGRKKILFDTGASDLFIKNAQTLNIDLAEADMCVISHGHYDHTGGVPAFCRINEKAPVIIHRNAFRKTYGFEDGVMDQEHCGIRWSEKVKEEIEPRLAFSKDIMKIDEDILISGTIPDIEGYEPTETFYEKGAEGTLIADDMSHEQFLVIRDRDEKGESRGIFIFSGCSHKGVVPVISYARSLFPGEKIAGLVAGMHLYSADADTRRNVVAQVAAENMDMCMPVHCTGIDAICDLKTIMGDKCIVATAGDVYEY